MARKLVIGNWKMNGSYADIDKLSRGLLQSLRNRPPVAEVEVAVCPPFVYLERVGQLLAESGIALGAQDVSDQDSGAYTGEVAAGMLADVGCRYVIIGHSERRQRHAEGETLVAAKIERVLAVGLIPIVCVGETLAQREADATLSVIDAQLEPVLQLGQSAEKLVLAYEPVWAIGTGRTASPEQAQAVHAHMRQRLQETAPELGRVPLLYGGSVKPDNARDLFAQTDIDGGLIGGAALDVEQFTAIWRTFE